jgi:hypothetical protein
MEQPRAPATVKRASINALGFLWFGALGHDSRSGDGGEECARRDTKEQIE